MTFSKFRKLFPTIIFILVCVLVSIVVLNFFQVNMNDNNGFRVLSRVLTVEGMKGRKKKEGMCGSGKHNKGMCGLMEGMCTIEGMKNKKKNKDSSDDEENGDEENNDEENSDEENSDEESDDGKDKKEQALANAITDFM